MTSNDTLLDFTVDKVVGSAGVAGQVRGINLLNRVLGKFSWGCFYDGVDHQEDPGCWRRFRTLDPREFHHLKGGCCWDYTNFEAEFFARHFPACPVRCWYWEGVGVDGENGETHAWLTFTVPGDPGVHLFESSWKPHVGITRFESVEAMVDVYAELLTTNPAEGWTVYEYSAGSVAVDLGVWEFMTRIYREGTLVKTVGGHFEKFIEDCEWTTSDD